jgi:anti-sigma B factor antagonist
MDRQARSTHPEAEPAVIILPAELDITNSAQVGDQLAAAFGTGVSTVIADMTSTTFCDSSGVRTLMLAHKNADADGAELRVAGPCRAVLRIFELTGVDVLLPIYPDLEAAVAGKNRS